MLANLLTNGFSFENIIISLIVYALIILVCLPIHEFSHAFMAYKLGDSTAKNSGRCTLNPFAHLSLQGTIMILIIGIGYAKPVPVNSWNFKKPKSGMALTAFAGPLSNLILAFLALLISRILAFFSQSVLIHLFLTQFAVINISLAVFNLIPVPPLDGSKILSALLPNKYYYLLQKHEQMISMIFMGIIFASMFLNIPIFGTIIGVPANAILQGFQWFINLIFRIFGT